MRLTFSYNFIRIGLKCDQSDTHFSLFILTNHGRENVTKKKFEEINEMHIIFDDDSCLRRFNKLFYTKIADFMKRKISFQVFRSIASLVNPYTQICMLLSFEGNKMHFSGNDLFIAVLHTHTQRT